MCCMYVAVDNFRLSASGMSCWSSRPSDPCESENCFWKIGRCESRFWQKPGKRRKLTYQNYPTLLPSCETVNSNLWYLTLDCYSCIIVHYIVVFCLACCSYPDTQHLTGGCRKRAQMLLCWISAVVYTKASQEKAGCTAYKFHFRERLTMSFTGGGALFFGTVMTCAFQNHQDARNSTLARALQVCHRCVPTNGLRREQRRRHSWECEAQGGKLNTDSVQYFGNVIHSRFFWFLYFVTFVLQCENDLTVWVLQTQGVDWPLPSVSEETWWNFCLKYFISPLSNGTITLKPRKASCKEGSLNASQTDPWNSNASDFRPPKIEELFGIFNPCASQHVSIMGKDI